MNGVICLRRKPELNRYLFSRVLFLSAKDIWALMGLGNVVHMWGSGKRGHGVNEGVASCSECVVGLSVCLSLCLFVGLLHKN